jgi:hypothetical protein
MLQSDRNSFRNSSHGSSNQHINNLFLKVKNYFH